MPEFDFPPTAPIPTSENFNEVDLVGLTASTVVLTSKVSGDVSFRYKMAADGQQIWGDGTGTFDIKLYRSAVRTLTVEAIASSAVPTFTINATAGTNRILGWTSSGSNRWLMFANNSAEGGANAGSDFNLQSYSDVGVVLRTDVAITRSSGVWALGGTIQAGTDNTPDLGGTSNRWRNVYWGTQALAPNGSAANPSYSFASDGTLGFAYNSGFIFFEKSSTIPMQFGATGPSIPDGFSLGFTSTAGAAPNVMLWRGGANVLQQSNGVTAQIFRQYNTTDSNTTPVDYERAFLGWSGNTYTITTESSGAGTARAMSIGTGGATNLGFRINGSDRWSINTSLQFLPAVDNTNDVGGSSNRPRIVYVGTSVTLATAATITWASDLILRRAASGTLQQSNGVTSQAFKIYDTTDSDTTPVNYQRGSFSFTAGTMTIAHEVGGTGVLQRMRLVAGDFMLKCGSTDAWNLSSAFHLLPQTDNAYDIGAAAANKIRNLFVGTLIRTGNGAVGTPSYSFNSETTTGIYWAASNDVRLTLSGTDNFRFTASGVIQSAALYYAWGSSGVATPDTFLRRGGASIVSQSNTTTTQLGYYVYNTTDSDSAPVNYERGTFGWVSGTTLQLGLTIAGTGTTRNMLILNNSGNTGGNGAIQMSTNGSTRWTFTNSGSFVPNTDNANDLGITGANRVRNAFFGTSVQIGTNQAATGAVRLANTGAIIGRNAANGGDVEIIQVNASDQVLIGGGGADVKFGRALIALGGGSAPTLGTIGGTGPATAGQNSWKKEIDSTGAAYYIPIWK